jgi:hypothetical protein
MQNYKVLSWKTKTTLFEGHYLNFKRCLQDAIEKEVCLKYADLTGANLSNTDLDCSNFYYVKFDNVNLQGANLTECHFEQCSFVNANLQAVCLAYSTITSCDFTGAIMHGCDIAGTALSKSIFSTRSACQLNFIDTERLSNCLYRHQDETLCSFSRPPIHIQGLELPFTIFDDCLLAGNTQLHPSDIESANDNITPNRALSGTLYNFIVKHHEMFTLMYKSRISK